MDGQILQVQRERDKPYLYMPNPAVLHHRSVKIEHHLKIVDFYIHAGCPQDFLVEPILGEYRPDVYMKDPYGNAICVEVQITPISTKKMQAKIDQFVASFGKTHDARYLLLVTDGSYNKVNMHSDFKLLKIPTPHEPEV